MSGIELSFDRQGMDMLYRHLNRLPTPVRRAIGKSNRQWAKRMAERIKFAAPTTRDS